MNWLETTIYTSKQGLEVVTGLLLQLGVTGFVIQDPDDYDEFLTLQGTTWDYMDEEMEKLKDCPTSIKIYLADNMQGNETLIELKNTLTRLKNEDIEGLYGDLRLELGNINEEDWANNWKKYFKPFEVGKHFVIKPSWEKYEKVTERYILEIDPNSSFGTGQHYSTQLCMEQLEKLEIKGQRVLDMGCGSGILSIAALLLGAKEVTAVDIDQNSADIARDNLQKNHMSETTFQVYCGNVLEDDDFTIQLGSQYDLVLANIVADVIIAMKELLKGFLRPGGQLITSGIIGERAEEVKCALETAGFKVHTLTEKNDWIALGAVLKEE
ncbi:50S ribosomal protein L11 methyltransferase [Sporanaerobium hydrogeniformans]|uniref:50S ribosomal protein L11 methyltransferase n=1 Tax=Sporanaerobium hydrogeniformans TaxID=3072179 RepID=A0AC61DFL8_9FIRM|nr:50S ribosomal protein L11 methyltransferase [Sporanaerobium hydrogeniformans]PHV71516.1 50S ribosomal protein L11 methyltransferase [Sporanaerobium hydrogeniformans]